MKLSKLNRRKVAHCLALILSEHHREHWVHPVNRRRVNEGDEVRLDRKYNHYPDRFRKALRLTPDQFDELLRLLGTSIVKDSSCRGSIPTRVRLYVTLK